MSQIVVFGAGAHTLYVTVQLAPSSPVGEAPPRPSSSLPAHVVAVCVNVEPTGNLSLVETLNVPACPGLARARVIHRVNHRVVVVPEQFVQVGSPPPRHRRRVHRRFAAFAATTATGTVITTGPLVPGQSCSPPDSSPHCPDSHVPPVAVIAPLVVPLPAMSLTSAVVGPFATPIVIVY